MGDERVEPLRRVREAHSEALDLAEREVGITMQARVAQAVRDDDTQLPTCPTRRGRVGAAVTTAAASALPGSDGATAVHARSAHTGGIERPRATLGAGRADFGLVFGATGVVSTSNRSLGLHSRAVHSAARVESFTWEGVFVNSADTEAEVSSTPARSASNRRSWAPVHTSRWAAAIRSFHLMSTVCLLELAQGVRERPPIGVLDEGCRRRDVAHRRADLPVFDTRVIHHAGDQLSEHGWSTSKEMPVGQFTPCLIRHREGREVTSITLGHPLLDDYLAFVAVRARTNTWLAVASDLKIFFAFVGKEPVEVTPADVFAFLAAQRTPRLGERVVRLEDGKPGLAARTIARRLSSVRGLYAYLTVRGDTGVARNPVPKSLAARRPGARRGKGGVPLIRTPRTLPRVLAPREVDALVSSLRTRRDRAMVEAMLLGGLRRCEVLGLRLEDVNAGERRLFIADGKGGRQRIVPVSARFFASLGEYLEHERPPDSTSRRLFVVLKGRRRGEPLTAAGLDEILDGARRRAGLERATCHQLRHTCFTRLREAGMALEAIQAQAGHTSIESTRIYLHLANDWLEKEYMRAAEAIEAQGAIAEEAAG